jgi:hypothetical protein
MHPVIANSFCSVPGGDAMAAHLPSFDRSFAVFLPWWSAWRFALLSGFLWREEQPIHGGVSSFVSPDHFSIHNIWHYLF